MIRYSPMCTPKGPTKTYRKIGVTEMRGPMAEPFECDSREGIMQGQAGDYIAADGHGGYYPISAEFHANNYVLADDAPAAEPDDTLAEAIDAMSTFDPVADMEHWAAGVEACIEALAKAVKR